MHGRESPCDKAEKHFAFDTITLSGAQKLASEFGIATTIVGEECFTKNGRLYWRVRMRASTSDGGFAYGVGICPKVSSLCSEASLRSIARNQAFRRCVLKLVRERANGEFDFSD